MKIWTEGPGKDEERQEEEATKQPKRFTEQEIARGFSLLEEALLVSEAEDQSIEQYTKVAAAVQNAVQCYWVFYDEKKSYHPDKAWIILFKRVDKIESSKEAEHMPSTSGVNEITVHPPSPIADDLSAVPSPTSSPFSISNSSCLLTRC